MERNDYLFSFNRKNQILLTSIKPTNNQIVIQKGIEGPTGPSGPAGKDGDRFCTKTINKVGIHPTKNSIIAISVESGLAYISGNSVIVAEVPNSLNDDINTFEGIVQYYSPLSGQIIIKDITNIHGEFEMYECYYHVNLDGVDGAPGEQGQPGPPGPQGPSNISETNIPLILLNNTITIPEQINPICYYTLNLINNDEIKNIQSNLKNNQHAIILIELSDVKNNDISSATLFTLTNTTMNINYDKNITLNIDYPFVMLKIYNINNNIFIESICYLKNNFISL